MSHPRAGTTATPDDLIDLTAVRDAYFSIHPDVNNPAQKVSFGTSGHRGSSLTGSFNENHIAAITQAIVEYRAGKNITGPIFVGKDTHALSDPAQDTVLEVLAGNNVSILADARNGWTPTPALSHAILSHNANPSQPRADGIIITPSHNPPADGGLKYNPPHGGPADTDATSWIAQRANELLANDLRGVKRMSVGAARLGGKIGAFDFMAAYVNDLPAVLDLEVIRNSGLRIGADPMGGASVDYWGAIAETHKLDLTVVNPEVDPRFAFMSLDTDGKIRMDCSSPAAMASLIAQRDRFDIATGNDADADRHGIVTPDAGLLNPNHFLSVAIEYLYANRTGWAADSSIGKTLVSSSMIDRVAASLGRELVEVPVGFKWFVPGLLDGSGAFGGEESAGASFLRHNGKVWTTDKDGIIMGLLASEMTAATGATPSQHYAKLTEKHGSPEYARIDAPANREQKAKLSNLSASDVSAHELAGEAITARLTEAPGNGAKIGGLKVTTENAWFAARPSGTEDVYKIYAESFKGADHLALVQAEAKKIVDSVLN